MLPSRFSRTTWKRSLATFHRNMSSQIASIAPSARFIKSVNPEEGGASPSTGMWTPGDKAEAATAATVQAMLGRIQEGGQQVCMDMARELDGFDLPTAVVSKAEIEEQIKDVPEQTRSDIQFQHERVYSFAEAQRASLKDMEVELFPGLVTGQKLLPVGTAGCYIPGGRYSHVSSATMTVATAKVAGVPQIIACSPPMAGTNKIHPGTLYAMHLAGADVVLAMGGVQAIGAMAYGCFTQGRSADVIVGPGNKFVAQAKRLLFGHVGIDMFAGPTEVMVLADHTADPWIIANDLAGQAEHGINSPAWLVTTCPKVAEEVRRITPDLAKALPEGSAAPESWRNFGEIILVDNVEEMAAVSDHYAAEHLQVQASNLDWWLERLQNYGSLFLGESAHTTLGDKCSGPNHVLPTKRVARYSGGLSVDKYLKKVTYQRMNEEATREIGVRASRISRLEGMEGHARSCDVRLAKYFPDEQFDITCKWTKKE